MNTISLEDKVEAKDALEKINISFIDAPVKKHKYEGTIGKTQGDKKLKRPAVKLTKTNKSIFHRYTLISNISNYLFLLDMMNLQQFRVILLLHPVQKILKLLP